MVSGGRSCIEYRDEGRFDGPRVDCEQVPLLPARAVAWVLDDSRKIPYLFVWKRAEDSSVREAVRVSAYSELAGWAEIKRAASGAWIWNELGRRDVLSVQATA